MLGGGSEYFRTRILRWESDRWSQHGADGKLVLVEECEEGEMEAAVAVVRLMYEAEVPPTLSALQLAEVRAAVLPSHVHPATTAEACSGDCRCVAWLTAGAPHPASDSASQL